MYNTGAMGHKEKNNESDDCRPVIINIRNGEVFPDDSPEMVEIMLAWEKLTKAERDAWHRVCCQNSRNELDMVFANAFSQEIERLLDVVSKRPKPPPKFEVCPLCKKHGRIVLGNNFFGPEFALQQEGEFYLDAGVSFDRFTKTQATAVRKDIKSSTLPKKLNRDVVRLCFRASVWNIQNATLDRLYKTKTNEGIHNFLFDPLVHYEVPASFAARLEEMAKSGWSKN